MDEVDGKGKMCVTEDITAVSLILLCIVLLVEF